MVATILFVCIGNSCRSQMAEAFTNAIHGKFLKAYSAGIRPSKLDPFTVIVMAEADIDVSMHQAKTIDSLQEISFDYVISVCGAGAESCPYIPAKKGNLRFEFRDPPQITSQFKEKEEKLVVYREVRDEIRNFVLSLADILQ